MEILMSGRVIQLWKTWDTRYSNSLFQLQVNPTLSVMHVPVTALLVQVQVFPTKLCLQSLHTQPGRYNWKSVELPGDISAVCDSKFSNLLHALPEYKGLHPLHSMCHLLLLLGIGDSPTSQPYTHKTQKTIYHTAHST